jgi:chromosome segregation ATPase
MGELVVLQGRAAGERCKLAGPFTLMGQAMGCQIRLMGDSVAPFHCALLLESSGYLLRILSPEADLRVNEAPVEVARLADGDEIAIGPYRFRFEAPALPTSEIPEQTLAEIEATRVQVAAVMAQQVALTEQEIQLDHRSESLQHHEQQIAAHLEARRAELETYEHVLKEQSHQLQEQQQLLETDRNALAQQREQSTAQQAAFRRAWRKRKRQLRHQTQRQLAEVAQREAQVEQQRRTNAEERERLRHWFEKHNGELEVRQRELDERGRELALDQQQWDAALNEEDRRRKQVVAELQQQHARLEAERAELAERQQQWTDYFEWLQRETKGLEARIAAQREELAATAPHPSGVEPIAPLEIATAAPAPGEHPWPDTLQEVAVMLDDQRAHLIEQWHHLLKVQDDWEQERTATQEEIEQVAQRLVEREQEIAREEARLHTLEHTLTQRSDWLREQETQLQAERVRFTLHESETLTRLETLQGELTHQLEHLEAVKQRRDALRQREMASLHEWIARLEESRQRYSDLWMDCERLREALQAGAEVHTEDRAVFREERRLLDERSEALAQREAQWADRLRELHGTEPPVGEMERLSEEVRQLRHRYGQSQRELRQVREELDRVVRALYEQPGPSAPPAAAA